MLSVHDLTRVYDTTTVLDGVSFDVRPGRMTGFVGANGAGKTTTMRIIVGVLAATRGTVTWDGAPIGTEQRRRIGYMPEERGLYPKMKVLDQLVFFGRLHGMAPDAAAARAHDLLGRLGLDERAGDVLETLSLGNQQRVQIAAALVHSPDALVMDEPFSGLDPLAVDSMVSLLRDEVSPQMPVLFSSHQLELVENLCDDLVILSRGRLVASGSVDDLRGRHAVRYRVVLAGDADAGALRDVPQLAVLDAQGPEALVEILDGPPEKALEIIQGTAQVAEFARVVRPLAQIYREAVR
jgi:ABC-2 type transport system ATP-binding protein